MLIEEFDAIIDDAPLDFLGTGESRRFANKCEAEWRKRVADFRAKLVAIAEFDAAIKKLREDGTIDPSSFSPLAELRKLGTRGQ